MLAIASRPPADNGFPDFAEFLRQGVADLRASTISIVEEVASASVVNAGPLFLISKINEIYCFS